MFQAADPGTITCLDELSLVNDKQPFAEVQLTVQHDTLACSTNASDALNPFYVPHIVWKQPRVYQTKGAIMNMIAHQMTRVQTKDHNDSLIAQINSKTVENADLKAQIQEKVFANVALKNELRKLKGNSVDTKFAKPSILGKPVLQPPRNQSVVRQPNAFKSERPNFSKPRFASQVDVNNVLSKPVTQHYLPKGRESAFAKPNLMIASSSSRNSSKNMPRFSSNDMVHNYYIEEAKKKTQERD
ncbi:hypothetical protein Tco_0572462 [Tanacetum coccineum]